ncbi:glycosyltransferase family 2 protein [Synechococcus sp. CBW1004]|jgi:hypothetical protein|uniref:glycosyltransferase family 2 protein n=1 Tax=Synechococcus sp. CBW1004 TaxID=1353136 RepID=UPI0018CE3E02|nr:glycosyltransferase family A protein [Synechococcus sp. CBW1004]QPN62669.1 glycosyltransferase family 2 protein [Synechococcus sp. CBW1004]
MGASDPAREGLSIVTVVMNRLAHLLDTAPRLSEWSVHREHLILDWSSDPPISRQSLPDDSRIRLVRVEGERLWHLTRAYNLAFRLAREPLILKLDADCWIDDPSSSWWPRLEAGSYQRSATGGGLNGIVLIRRQDFLAVGGFHEGLQGYGHDDKDLYGRLDRDLNGAALPVERLQTLEHGDAERVAAQRGLRRLRLGATGGRTPAARPDHLAALEAIARMEESKAINRLLAERWPWSCEQAHTRYESVGPERWRALPGSEPQAEPALMQQAGALGHRVYLSILLGLPERFLDQQIPQHDLERIRSWERVLQLQARLRLLLLLPLLRLGLRLQRALERLKRSAGRRGRS